MVLAVSQYRFWRPLILSAPKSASWLSLPAFGTTCPNSGLSAIDADSSRPTVPALCRRVGPNHKTEMRLSASVFFTDAHYARDDRPATPWHRRAARTWYTKIRDWYIRAMTTVRTRPMPTTRDRILDAAERLLARFGNKKTTMEDIARETSSCRLPGRRPAARRL